MKNPQYSNKRYKSLIKSLIYHVIIITTIMLIVLCNIPKVIVEKEDMTKASESYSDKTIIPCVSNSNMVTFESQAEKESSETKKIKNDYYPEFTYSKDWSEEENYLLAKIAMAEAEGCNTQTKALIIMCVLNRVKSDEFPNTIKEVIFEKNQFSPIDDGRWDRVEPNKDCYEAAKEVAEAKYDYSGGATYFESCENEDNWHSRNLEFLYKSEEMRFYK